MRGGMPWAFLFPGPCGGHSSSRRASSIRARRPRRVGPAASLALFLSLLPAAAPASPHEARVPLKDGKVSCRDLSAAVCRELHVKPVRIPAGDLDLNGLNGSTFVSAVNGSLNDGFRVTVTPDALVLHVDTDRLPKNCDAAKRAVRVFTAIEAPRATTAQRRHFGLHLPDAGGSGALDSGKPLVVLIHGLDSDCDMWGPMADLLRGQGYPVATFGFPGDGPIEESAALLGQCLADLHKAHPALRVDLVAHSMGGLVARSYVEGDDYAGGVDRLILLGTPNAGSSWARLRWVLGLREQYHLWQTDPDWSASWIVTDGLGEAGDELKPGSKFLTQLNARPRRPGVRYTIVAGNQHPASLIEAGCADSLARLIPRRAARWWGFRQCGGALARKADALRHRTGDDDGPVKLSSARLAGVDDFVVVPADHVALAVGSPPAAWEVIRDRLAR